MDKKKCRNYLRRKRLKVSSAFTFSRKIDHRELEAIGFDMTNATNFKKQYEFYKRTLFEGICNGILMCGGKIEGIDDGES